MKVLVVGGGGREHSLVWKIAQSDLVDEVIAAPGSDGMAQTPKCRCEPVSGEDVEGQIALAKREQVDLVVVGPEAPLVDGLADRLEAEGILVFGPSAAAAQLEGSKVFSKEFMQRQGIPTAAFSVHQDSESAIAEVNRRDGPCVVKADGLAAGKGVIVCSDAVAARKAVKEMLEDKRFGSAGDKILIEDCLVGEEASVLAICDGERVVPLVAAQDHKAAFEGDTGPNTGGMGAYAPAPVITDEMKNAVLEKVLVPTVKGMAKEGMPFKGVLYAGLMITDDKIEVLEFNVRFGDPECQPLMMFLKEDIVPVLEQAAKGALVERELAWHAGSTICVVIASKGYPGSYEKGKAMSGLDSADSNPNVTIFHAGTKLDGDRFVTSGGRVLGVTARGADLQAAAKEAYGVANKISFEGMRMRRDIGYRAL
jgi:phosphoribosylamine--glycine ligase